MLILRTFLSCLFAFHSGATAALEEPGSGATLARVPMLPSQGLVVVEVTISGEGPFRFSIDTAASGTGRIDQELAEKLGLKETGTGTNRDGTGGSARRSLVEVPKLSVENYCFGDLVMMTGDYTWVRGEGEGRIWGILGYRAFGGVLLILDDLARSVEIAEGALDGESDGVLKYDGSRGVPIVPLGIGDDEGVGVLDTGSDAQLSMPMEFTELLALKREPVEAGRAKSSLREFPIVKARLEETVRVGGFRFSGVEANFSDAWRYPVLGNRLLEGRCLTLDIDNECLRIAPGKNPEEGVQKAR